MTPTEMTARQLAAYFADFKAVRDDISKRAEHVTLQTGGSWGSAVGAYVGGEHTAPIPFTGWAGA